MTDPYATPFSPPDSSVSDRHTRRRRKFWFRAIWISIAAVVTPPIVGLIGSAVGMAGAFNDLSETGGVDSLDGNVSIALQGTALGLIVSLIAFIVLIGVLIRFFTLPKVEPPHPR